MKTLIDVRNSLPELVASGGLPADVAAQVGAANARPSPVDAVVGAFLALRALHAMSDDARQVLRDCAEQIAEHGFHGLAADAADVLENT